MKSNRLIIPAFRYEFLFILSATEQICSSNLTDVMYDATGVYWLYHDGCHSVVFWVQHSRKCTQKSTSYMSSRFPSNFEASKLLKSPKDMTDVILCVMNIWICEQLICMNEWMNEWWLNDHSSLSTQTCVNIHEMSYLEVYIYNSINPVNPLNMLNVSLGNWRISLMADKYYFCTTSWSKIRDAPLWHSRI